MPLQLMSAGLKCTAVTADTALKRCFSRENISSLRLCLHLGEIYRPKGIKLAGLQDNMKKSTLIVVGVPDSDSQAARWERKQNRKRE
jgi:hypothetical protein